MNTADLNVSDRAARRASRKATWRLIPFLTLCYVVAFLDRVNIGFAALTINKELGLTAEMFGFGAGVFFFGYFILEVPSNLSLERVGARRWIARIMISWAVISVSFAFVRSISAILQNLSLSFFDSARIFYLMRFIFGAAEAGFFPGIILYLVITNPIHLISPRWALARWLAERRGWRQVRSDRRGGRSQG
jgi:MFS transporter, ACS family, tartrate transporter